MGIKINNYAVNQVDKNTVIYEASSEITSISIILKGRVLAVNNGSKVLLGSGNFIGISDLSAGEFISSYIAYDEVLFYSFPARGIEELVEIFASNKDYKGLMVASLTRYISELAKIYNGLKLTAGSIYTFLEKYNRNYVETGTKLGYPVNDIPVVKSMTPYNNDDLMLDLKKLDYYKECAKIPVDTWKAFCSTGDTITLYLVEEAQSLALVLMSECDVLTEYIADLFGGLINNTENCLFKSYASLAISIEETGGNNSDLLKIIDSIIDQINNLEKLFDEKLGKNYIVNREKMEEIYYLLLSKNTNRKEQVDTNFQYSENEVKEVFDVLNNSLSQILTYSELNKEKADEFTQDILDFTNLKDKTSTEDSARLLRKKIILNFYDLYEAVFFKAIHDKQIPKAVDLFLQYGYIDEGLLSKDQLKELYFLTNDSVKEDKACRVYNIKSWLTCIFNGEKEPSKNEFDQDYVDMLREKRKRGEITEALEKEALENPIQKVQYEIHNMFRYNHRVVNGQIVSFIPFLWGENLIKGLQVLQVTRKRFNDTIKELMDIDYSVFHREVLYVNQEKGVSKEYIMQQVLPDIILMPTVGTNGVMWQEITGKKKSREGRFIFPAFTEGNLKEMLIKVFGRFRWELCRSIQGNAWNNIKEKSLTSEYSDYIQFYRKNRDLSEEAKEKLKNQIQKGKSNYREIFVLDYEAWIKGESNGALKLNKVAREILATYCPFPKAIREKVKGMPIFADSMERFNRNTYKKIKDLELRYRAIEKEGGELTEELMETFIFYRDL